MIFFTRHFDVLFSCSFFYSATHWNTEWQVSCISNGAQWIGTIFYTTWNWLPWTFYGAQQNVKWNCTLMTTKSLQSWEYFCGWKWLLLKMVCINYFAVDTYIDLSVIVSSFKILHFAHIVYKNFDCFHFFSLVQQ